jgi:hypothetical protein
VDAQICGDASVAFEVAEKNLQSRYTAEAILWYDTAEQLGHDADACAGARWVCHMLNGNYAMAWAESDSIEQRGKPDRNRFWNGTTPNGRRVLIRCLHGLGDTLQYVRFVAKLREQAKQISIEAQPALKTLLIESGIADEVITWGEPEPPWDLQMEAVELPRIFRTTLETLPRRVPYVVAPPSRLRLTPGRLHIGIVWGSGSHDMARCIPIELLSRIFTAPGCEFFSFQAGEEQTQIGPWKTLVRDLQEQNGCVLRTASRLMNMDLLITVDTMIAHLGGALGLPVWTLLPFAADWRWLLDREDSPWYPTMRLFRQPQPLAWEPVVARLKDELTKAAAREA